MHCELMRVLCRFAFENDICIDRGFSGAPNLDLERLNATRVVNCVELAAESLTFWMPRDVHMDHGIVQS